MLCLSSYLSTIKNNMSVNATQKILVGKIMMSIDPNFEESDDNLISNLVHGKRNPSVYTIENAQNLVRDKSLHPEYIQKFQEVISLIDPNKLYRLKQEIIQIILEDNKIQGTTIVDIVNNTDKDHLTENKCSLDSFLAGILLYVLTATKHRTGKKSAVAPQKQLNNLKAPVTNTIAESNNSDIPEDVFLSAQDFCIKYEKELGLLPLCQIAFSIDPLHNNVRSMYTDYIRCPQKVKEAILRIKGIPLLEYHKGWVNKAIDHYTSLVNQYELSTIDFLYEDAKYLHRAFDNYSDYPIDDPDPYIFKRPFKNKSNRCITQDYQSTIGFYIDDYLWYKNTDPSYNVLPPMDYLWKFCNLENCDEPEMTFWICRFIISSSFHICEEDQDIEELWKSVSIDDQLMKTQEDMYYYALLQLYLLTLSEEDCKMYIVG